MIMTKVKVQMEIKLNYGYVIGNVVRSHFPEAIMAPNCFPVISDDVILIEVLVDSCPDMAGKVAAANQDYRVKRGSVKLNDKN